jgi:hypothetical protein
MDGNDPWGRLLAAAGAVGAVIALIYVVGGTSLALRYEGLGLPGNLSAALTPREVLAAAGLRTLAVWTALGAVLVFALRAIPDATVLRGAGWLGTRWGVGAVAAAGLLLLLTLRVWWPLAAVVAVLTIILSSVYWRSRPVRRFLAALLSVALVAVAYEADRLTYRLERTCVRYLSSPEVNESATAPRGERTRGTQRICGTLIGQQDRGFYLGAENQTEIPADSASEGDRLLFIPQTKVEDAYSEPQLARVLTSSADDRRETLVSRLWNIDVR